MPLASSLSSPANCAASETSAHLSQSSLETTKVFTAASGPTPPPPPPPRCHPRALSRHSPSRALPVTTCYSWPKSLLTACPLHASGPLPRGIERREVRTTTRARYLRVSRTRLLGRAHLLIAHAIDLACRPHSDLIQLFSSCARQRIVAIHSDAPWAARPPSIYLSAPIPHLAPPSLPIHHQSSSLHSAPPAAFAARLARDHDVEPLRDPHKRQRKD